MALVHALDRVYTRYQLVLFLISTSHPDPAGRLKAVGAAAGAKVIEKTI